MPLALILFLYSYKDSFMNAYPCFLRLMCLRFYDFLQFLKEHALIQDNLFLAQYSDGCYRIDTGETGLKYYVTGSLSVRAFLGFLDSLGFVQPPFYNENRRQIKFPIRFSEAEAVKIFLKQDEDEVIAAVDEALDEKINVITLMKTGFFCCAKDSSAFVRELRKEKNEPSIAKKKLKDYILLENNLLKKRRSENEFS